MAFVTQPLVGLVLLVVSAAMAVASAAGLGARPNRRSAIGLLVSAALCVGGWLLIRG